MSQIIPIVPLSGEISSPKNLSGSLSADDPINGRLSGDIVHRSYNDLADKPSINEVTLMGDKSFEDLGLGTLSDQDIDEIIQENGGYN